MAKSPWRQRLEARWWLWTHHAKALNRRAVVEEYLLDHFRGKAPMTPEIARILAHHLGVPQDEMTLKDRLKQHMEATMPSEDETVKAIADIAGALRVIADALAELLESYGVEDSSDDE